MTTQTTGDTTADRQRARSLRGIGRSARGSQARLPSPPRQRRPGLAALAVLLIVGGALAAYVLAEGLNERVPVLVAKESIPAGTPITDQNTTEEEVAYPENLKLITVDQLAEVEGRGLVARTSIARGRLLDTELLVPEAPLASGGDYAIVSVLLTPGLSPKDVSPDDIVQVIRAAQDTGNGSGRTLTEAYVLNKSGSKRDDFGGGTSGSVNLLVPKEAAEAVVDAAGNNRAGLAILSRGNDLDNLSLAVAGN
jgi:hypothetical protein